MEIDSLQKQLESLKGDYEKLDLKNTQLNEILAQKELAIKEVILLVTVIIIL